MKEAGCRDQDGDGILEKNGKPLELNLVSRTRSSRMEDHV